MILHVDSPVTEGSPARFVPPVREPRVEQEPPSTGLQLEHATVRRLSRLEPWKSGAYIALISLLIVTAAWICQQSWNPLSYVITVAFIGARQHDLGSMIHEAVHGRLARHRRWNDWIGECLSFLFLFFSMRAFRRSHLAHHRHFNGPGDPDWVLTRNPTWDFPMRPAKLMRILAARLFGFGILRSLVLAYHYPRESRGHREVDGALMRFARGVFLGGAILGIQAFDAWSTVLLYWLVPLGSWLPLCLHIRSIAEHFALPSGTSQPQSRSVRLTWIDRLFIVSNAMSYHGEHHRYPSVPFYNLRTLHEFLVEMPGYRSEIALTEGYRSVLTSAVGFDRSRCR